MHTYQFIRKIEKVHLLIGFLLRLTIFTWPMKIEYHQIKEPLAVAIMISGRCVPLCALCYMYTLQRSFNQSKCLSKFFSNTFRVYNWFGFSKNRIEEKSTHTLKDEIYENIVKSIYANTNNTIEIKWTDQIGMTIQFCFDKETTWNDWLYMRMRTHQPSYMHTI